MSLPPRLRPWWPLLKRGHRTLSAWLGVLFRLVSPLLGERGVPTRATSRSTDTAAATPGAALHPGGAAEALTRGPARGEPAQHWVVEDSRVDLTPARYTLELPGGRVTGDYAAVTTPGKLLDFQLSGYFGISSWRQHPLYLRPTLGPEEVVDGTVLSLAARGASTNYYHFLFDALARYGLFRECLPDRELDAVVVPHGAGYQRQLLAMVGLDRHRLIQPERGRSVRADRLLVPSTPNQDLAAPSDAVRWLREHLPSTGRRSACRLYVTRGDLPGTRRWTQERELVPWLEQEGFEVVDPGSYSVQEQIDLFSGAELVVGPHGAGLTNILFCPPGARVLELFAASYVHLGLRNIAETRGDLRYRYLVADGDHHRGRPMTGNYDDVDLDPDRVRRAVRSLLADPAQPGSIHP